LTVPAGEQSVEGHSGVDVAVPDVVGQPCARLHGPARARFRRRTCGFIAQGLTLLPQATAAADVEAPLLLDGVKVAERHRRGAAALERVGPGVAGFAPGDRVMGFTNFGAARERIAVAADKLSKITADLDFDVPCTDDGRLLRELNGVG